MNCQIKKNIWKIFTFVIYLYFLIKQFKKQSYLINQFIEAIYQSYLQPYHIQATYTSPSNYLYTASCYFILSTRFLILTMIVIIITCILTLSMILTALFMRTKHPKKTQLMSLIVIGMIFVNLINELDLYWQKGSDNNILSEAHHSVAQKAVASVPEDSLSTPATTETIDENSKASSSFWQTINTFTGISSSDSLSTKNVVNIDQLLDLATTVVAYYPQPDDHKLLMATHFTHTYVPADDTSTTAAHIQANNTHHEQMQKFSQYASSPQLSLLFRNLKQASKGIYMRLIEDKRLEQSSQIYSNNKFIKGSSSSSASIAAQQKRRRAQTLEQKQSSTYGYIQSSQLQMKSQTEETPRSARTPTSKKSFWNNLVKLFNQLFVQDEYVDQEDEEEEESQQNVIKQEKPPTNAPTKSSHDHQQHQSYQQQYNQPYSSSSSSSSSLVSLPAPTQTFPQFWTSHLLPSFLQHTKPQTQHEQRLMNFLYNQHIKQIDGIYRVGNGIQIERLQLLMIGLGKRIGGRQQEKEQQQMKGTDKKSTDKSTTTTDETTVNKTESKNTIRVGYFDAVKQVVFQQDVGDNMHNKKKCVLNKHLLLDNVLGKNRKYDMVNENDVDGVDDVDNVDDVDDVDSFFTTLSTTADTSTTTRTHDYIIVNIPASIDNCYGPNNADEIGRQIDQLVRQWYFGNTRNKKQQDDSQNQQQMPMRSSERRLQLVTIILLLTTPTTPLITRMPNNYFQHSLINSFSRTFANNLFSSGATSFSAGFVSDHLLQFSTNQYVQIVFLFWNKFINRQAQILRKWIKNKLKDVDAEIDVLGNNHNVDQQHLHQRQQIQTQRQRQQIQQYNNMLKKIDQMAELSTSLLRRQLRQSENYIEMDWRQFAMEGLIRLEMEMGSGSEQFNSNNNNNLHPTSRTSMTIHQIFSMKKDRIFGVLAQILKEKIKNAANVMNSNNGANTKKFSRINLLELKHLIKCLRTHTQHTTDAINHKKFKQKCFNYIKKIHKQTWQQQQKIQQQQKQTYYQQQQQQHYQRKQKLQQLALPTIDQFFVIIESTNVNDVNHKVQAQPHQHPPQPQSPRDDGKMKIRLRKQYYWLDLFNMENKNQNDDRHKIDDDKIKIAKKWFQPFVKKRDKQSLIISQ